MSGAVWVLTGLLLGVVVSVAVPQADFPAEDRIVVLGDIHGDYERMREILEVVGIIDRRGRWKGGSTHLVQLGDLPDRGPRSLEAGEFLRKLARAARRKGGAVHVLVGNHEAMNVYGDLRYVDPGEFDEFRTRDSKRYLEVIYEEEVAFIKANNPKEVWPTFDAEFKRKWMESRPPGWVEHRLSWEAGGETNAWVNSRPAVIRIGENLFMHGGLGPAYAEWSLEGINRVVSESLANPANYRDSILREEDGPLWYRGLARGDETTEEAHLEALLARHGVKRIVLGHTVTGGIILPRFEGRVLLADVGLSRYYGDNMACLIIEGDVLTAVHRNGEVVFPEALDEQGMIDYVRAVSAVEPDNRFIAHRLERLLNPAEVEPVASPDPDLNDIDADPETD